MNVIYPDKVDRLQDSALLQEATKLLEKTTRTTSSGMPAVSSASDVTAVWSLQERDGRPVYVLKLSDPASDATTEFLPSDLRNPGQSRDLPFRLARLWGDLLEKRSHKLLEELKKLRG